MKRNIFLNKIKEYLDRPKTRKQKYLYGYFAIVIVLAFARLIYVSAISDSGVSANSDSQNAEKDKVEVAGISKRVKHHPILGVHSYRKSFPDNNDVQLLSARKYGVKPVKNRKDAEQRLEELVFIESSPYFHVDPLTRSIPYLVPKAYVLVQDIGKAFMDSLYVKGLPLHKIIVTSVLRTRDDIAKLKKYNVNATENSCHLYGTTVDICYNRYQSLQLPGGVKNPSVRNDTLKWVLSEVLRDFRNSKRCHIKYEVKQGCFHMTVN